MRILGIDPGSRVSGYGIIDKEGSCLRHVAHGEIKPPKDALLSAALIYLYSALAALIRDASPAAIAVENIFYGKNVRSLIKQAHVRGVILLAGADLHIPIFEYSPLEVKQAVVGYGRAEKNQVQVMVKAILQLPALPPADAADALAVAVCHANFQKEQAI